MIYKKKQDAVIHFLLWKYSKQRCGEILVSRQQLLINYKQFIIGKQTIHNMLSVTDNNEALKIF